MMFRCCMVARFHGYEGMGEGKECSGRTFLSIVIVLYRRGLLMVEAASVKNAAPTVMGNYTCGGSTPMR